MTGSSVKSSYEVSTMFRHAFMLTGIPENYYRSSYSDALGEYDEEHQNIVRKFLSKELKGLIMFVDNYDLPYIIFRRLVVIRTWIHGEAKILNGYDIQNNNRSYTGQKLFGVFRIDIDQSFNKSRILESIVESYRQGAQLVVATTNKDVQAFARYADNIWDIFEQNSFGVIKV